MAALNSLSNFGVPGYRNGERSAVLQPIYSTHFRVKVENFGSFDPAPSPYDITRQVKSVTLPSVTFEVATLPSYVSIVYAASRGQWEEGSMTFRDDISNGTRRRIENQIAKQKNFVDQTMALAASDYKFEMDVDILAGGGSTGTGTANVIRRYSYVGCFLTSVDDGEMQYENSNVKEVSARFRYDNCVAYDYNGYPLSSTSHGDYVFGNGSLENAFSIGLNFGGRIGGGSAGINIGGNIDIGSLLGL